MHVSYLRGSLFCAWNLSVQIRHAIEHQSLNVVLLKEIDSRRDK